MPSKIWLGEAVRLQDFGDRVLFVMHDVERPQQ
jgi:hypothetical protein